MEHGNDLVYTSNLIKLGSAGTCRQYGDTCEKLISLKLTVRGDSHSSKTAILPGLMIKQR